MLLQDHLPGSPSRIHFSKKTCFLYQMSGDPALAFSVLLFSISLNCLSFARYSSQGLTNSGPLLRTWKNFSLVKGLIWCFIFPALICSRTTITLSRYKTLEAEIVPSSNFSIIDNNHSMYREKNSTVTREKTASFRSYLIKSFNHTH